MTPTYDGRCARVQEAATSDSAFGSLLLVEAGLAASTGHSPIVTSVLAVSGLGLIGLEVRA